MAVGSPRSDALWPVDALTNGVVVGLRSTYLRCTAVGKIPPAVLDLLCSFLLYERGAHIFFRVHAPFFCYKPTIDTCCFFNYLSDSKLHVTTLL
jgi:hypothetical protein